MSRLIKMDLFRMRKSKALWISGIIIFVMCIILPILAKMLAQLVLDLVKNGDDAQSIEQAQQLVDEFNRPAAMSGVFRTMFGGLSLLLILVLVSASIFMFADLNHGYIKNIAGQLSNRGYLVISKFIVVNIQNIILLVISTLGTAVGVGVSRGIEYDSGVPDALLEYLVKILLLCGITAIVMFFTIGLHNKSLGIVAAVFFGLSALAIIATPLQLIMTNVAKIDFVISDYLPDALFASTDINKLRATIVALVCILVFLPVTLRFVNKRDVK